MGPVKLIGLFWEDTPYGHIRASKTDNLTKGISDNTKKSFNLLSLLIEI